MNLVKNRIGLLVLFSAAFGIGCLLGIKTTSHLYHKYCLSQILDYNAVELAAQIDTICQLRLGQVGAIIDDLEKGIDWNIVALANSNNIQEDDYRYNVLRAAKTYRDIYPYRSRFTDMVDDILDDIEKIDSFECESPLCCLVRSAGHQRNL